MIGDGDKVSVTSPILASINFSSGAINTSETFDATFHTSKQEKIDNTDGDMKATLYCYDNNIFDFQVREN